MGICFTKVQTPGAGPALDAPVQHNAANKEQNRSYESKSSKSNDRSFDGHDKRQGAPVRGFDKE
jgi:hypothetical protein